MGFTNRKRFEKIEQRLHLLEMPYQSIREPEIPPCPDWCRKGKEVEVRQGESPVYIGTVHSVLWSKEADHYHVFLDSSQYCVDLDHCRPYVPRSGEKPEPEIPRGGQAMSVKGWEFDLEEKSGFFRARAVAHDNLYQLRSSWCPTERDANVRLEEIRSSVLAFELAGRGFDTLKMMAVSATLSSGQSTLEELDAAQVIMDAFYSALAEIEGDK